MCALVLVIPSDLAEVVITQVSSYPCVNHITKVPTRQPTEICAVLDINARNCPEFYQAEIAARHPGVTVSLGVSPL